MEVRYVIIGIISYSQSLVFSCTRMLILRLTHDNFSYLRTLINQNIPSLVSTSIRMFNFILKQSPITRLICAENNGEMKYSETTAFVHTDDVANAHIFLFEYPNAKGRYICSAVEITVDKLAEFLSARYPEFQIRNEE